MKRHLFLIRTPFQAFLCSKIIEQEHIRDYDVLYISRDRKDDHYFARLEKGATHATIFRHPSTRGRVSGYWKAIRSFPLWLIRRRYSQIHVASFYVWYFRVILRWKRTAIWTYDDGAGNYTMSLYKLSSKRDRLICWILRGVPLEQVVSRAEGHHAVRPDLENIVTSEKIAPVRLRPNRPREGAPVTIIIGQNFHEYLSLENERNLLEYVRTLSGRYFPHPREVERPFEVVRSEMILEDFVASQQGPVTLVGGFSTALITIDGVRKLYLDADRDARRRAIMTAVGCELVEL